MCWVWDCFLSPYSPNLNLIKKFWESMKRWIRQKIEFRQGLYQSISASFSLS
ncbi:transposase [Holospora obtusa]|uniref:transposase n=1 Tax=Holospora obtusa TaxID=49893 RepID=UPI0012EB5BF5